MNRIAAVMVVVVVEQAIKSLEKLKERIRMPYLEISGEYLAGSLLLKGPTFVGGKITTSSLTFCKVKRKEHP